MWDSSKSSIGFVHLTSPNWEGSTHNFLNLFDQGTSILLTDIPINLSETIDVTMNTISERGVYTDTFLGYPANVSHETTQESIYPGPGFSS